MLDRISRLEPIGKEEIERENMAVPSLGFYPLSRKVSYNFEKGEDTTDWTVSFGPEVPWTNVHAQLKVFTLIPSIDNHTHISFFREPLIECGVEWLNPHKGRGPGWNNATENSSPPVLDPSLSPRPSSFTSLNRLLFQLNLWWICLRRCQRHQRQQRSPAKFSPLQHSLQWLLGTPYVKRAISQIL